MPTPDLKYRAIVQQLTTEILAEKYRRTGRLPSEAQLVKRFLVSRSTVRQALRELQDDGLIERRPGSGSYVKLTDAVARRPARGAPARRRIGLIVPALRHTEIFEQITAELAAMVRASGNDFWPSLAPTPLHELVMSAAEADALVERFISEGVDGVFFVPFEHQDDYESVNFRLAERLRLAGIAVVLIDRDLAAFPQRSHFDLIGVDNFLGGHLLANHLIRSGRRRVGFLARPHTAATVTARIAGARAAMLAHGLKAPQNFLQEGSPTDAKWVRTIVKPAQFDAIMCASDHVASQLLQTLGRLGLRCPQDIVVTGFDDLPFASLLSPSLTTVSQSCRDLAVTACEAMKQRLVDPTTPVRSQMVTPHLVVRSSCGGKS